MMSFFYMIAIGWVLFIHFMLLWKRGHSLWYGVAIIFRNIEAVQNAVIMSLPFWWKTWRQHYNQEKEDLKGVL